MDLQVPPSSYLQAPLKPPLQAPFKPPLSLPLGVTLKHPLKPPLKLPSKTLEGEAKRAGLRVTPDSSKKDLKGGYNRRGFGMLAEQWLFLTLFRDARVFHAFRDFSRR